MQITDILAKAQGGELYDNIAEVYGLEPAEVEAVAGNVLPFLASAIERNTLSRGGLADIVGALGDGHHQMYLEDPRFIGSQVMVSDGNNILGHILGSVDRSRAVADKVAATSGVGADWVRKLLPILAALVMGALSKGSSGGLGDIIRKLPGGADNPGVPSGGDLGDILRRMGIPGLPGSDGPVAGGGRRGGGGGWGDGGGSGGGGVGDIFKRVPGLPGSRDGSAGGSVPGFPDQPAEPQARPTASPAPRRPVPDDDGRDGDNPFDGLPGGLGDILKRLPGMQPDRQPSPQSTGRRAEAPQPFPDQGGGSIGDQSPLPIPGSRIPGGNDGSGPRDNPYGDLRDIIRKGQMPNGANVPGGGSLGGVVRDILGGLLGFQGRGLFGWIIQLLIYRWGWGILKRILGGLFARR